jgi:type IV pilus assembly protein PilB
MVERRNLGQILMGFGRITEEEMERALEYQRENGGYFGEALLALGLVRKEELEWSLASQFDIPYVFPDAESVDPDAVALVSPEWALAHLALPILKTSEAVNVIVDSPMKSEAVEELHRRTGLRIELALAPAESIRELIRKVYAQADPMEEGADAFSPLPIADLLGAALEHGASRFGISVRGRRLMGWYEARGRVRRRLVTSSWERDLEDLLSPPPSEAVKGSEARWTAQLSQHGMTHPVEVRFLSSPAGIEVLFRPVEERTRIQERFPPPSRGTVEEIRLLARSGSARFAVVTEPAELADEIVPYLPAILLDRSRRSVHVGEREIPGEEVFSVAVPSDPAERNRTLKELRSFHFDAVTADLSGSVEEWVEPVLNLASTAFIRWDPRTDRRAAEAAGIRWQLDIEAEEGQELTWTLRPIKS